MLQCKIHNCSKRIYLNDLCTTHYVKHNAGNLSLKAVTCLMPGCAGKPCTDSFCKGHSRANCTAHINQLLSCEAIKDIDFGQIKVLAEALEHRENNSQRALDEDTYNAKVTAITRSEA